MNFVGLNATITRDLELQYSQAGKAWMSFSVAYNHTKTEASFFDCKVFGQQAEFISQYFAKGDGINLQGELKQETWEDKNGGGKRSKIVVNVRRADFPRGKKGGGNGGASDEGERQPAMAGGGGGYSRNENDTNDALGIDDIPF